MPRCTDTAWLAGLHTHYTHSSLGSFFAFEPLTGSYEVNPPFDPGSVRATYEHIDRLLRKNEAKSKLDEQQCGEYASLPLLFVVVAPRGMDRNIDRVQMTSDSDFRFLIRRCVAI